jgi:quinol monooxygenase YgiN
MEDIRLNGRLMFEPKDYEEVAGICEKNASDARRHPGMLEYSFWANGERDTIYIHEHYESPDALVNHLQNMDKAAVGRLLQIARLGTMECCTGSDPDPLVTATLGGFGVPINVYSPVASR